MFQIQFVNINEGNVVSQQCTNNFVNKITTNWKGGCILGSDVIYYSKYEVLLPVNLL
jgi:hypothetical protein